MEVTRVGERKGSEFGFFFPRTLSDSLVFSFFIFLSEVLNNFISANLHNLYVFQSWED